MSRLADCKDCGHTFESESHECPKCGSRNLIVHLNLSDDVSFAEQLKGKAKVQGIKKPTKEFIYGDDYSRSLNKFVDKTRVIDRENDRYVEIVTDKETNEVIHNCQEPLSEHFNHGSAKPKKVDNT